MLIYRCADDNSFVRKIALSFLMSDNDPFLALRAFVKHKSVIKNPCASLRKGSQ